MKRIFAALFLLSVVFIMPSCEDCRECHVVTVDENGNIISEGQDNEFCAQDLSDVEDEEPVTVGGNTTRWECD
ncbi:MAG: hypothetical protein KKA07_07695 [Bacteroidetes bacterium]|nr:hypothetical protein [Bacteroidota bacterium]MBU1718945.1 hypothetical protein [Bacteroidota bacterium]